LRFRKLDRENRAATDWATLFLDKGFKNDRSSLGALDFILLADKDQSNSGGNHHNYPTQNETPEKVG
jgi:hypothetical protein